MSNPTPAQLNALLQYASGKLGIPAEQLAKTVSDGGLEKLSSQLSPSAQQTLQTLVGDPQKAQALLSSPQIQELLRRFSQ